MIRGNVDLNVQSVASHTRRKTVTPSTQKKYLKVGENPQEKETVKQEEETGRETSRGGEAEVKVGKGKKRNRILEVEFNLLTAEKKLVEL